MVLAKIKQRPFKWKQKSAGGFPLNFNGCPLDRLGVNALKSTYSTRKGRKK